MFIDVDQYQGNRMTINTDHIISVTENTNTTFIALTSGRTVEIKESYWNFVNRIYFHVVEYRGETDG